MDLLKHHQSLEIQKYYLQNALVTSGVNKNSTSLIAFSLLGAPFTNSSATS